MQKSKKKLLFLLVIPALGLYAGSRVQKITTQTNAENTAELLALNTFSDETQVPSQAEKIMKTLSAAYPDRISPAEFRKISADQSPDEEEQGDWAFRINGRWFYYAEGRILPGIIRFGIYG